MVGGILLVLVILFVLVAAARCSWKKKQEKDGNGKMEHQIELENNLEEAFSRRKAFEKRIREVVERVEARQAPQSQPSSTDQITIEIQGNEERMPLPPPYNLHSNYTPCSD